MRRLEDCEIVDLYWARSEDAITETQKKYARMLLGISLQLVPQREDALECVNDTYLAAWNSMPAARPTLLGAFLSKIVRRVSVTKYRRSHAEKRGGYRELTEELCECVPAETDLESMYNSRQISDLLNRFVATLDSEKRYIFVRRYFYADSLSDIARHLGVSEGKIKTVLHRTRKALAEILRKEGLEP